MTRSPGRSTTTVRREPATGISDNFTFNSAVLLGAPYTPSSRPRPSRSRRATSRFTTAANPTRTNALELRRPPGLLCRWFRERPRAGMASADHRTCAGGGYGNRLFRVSDVTTTPIRDTSVDDTWPRSRRRCRASAGERRRPQLRPRHTGVVRWINPAAKELVGDRGRHYTSVVAPEDTRRARELFSQKVLGTPRQQRRPASWFDRGRGWPLSSARWRS